MIFMENVDEGAKSPEDEQFEIWNLIRACSSGDRFKSVQIKICITTRDGNQVMGNDFCKEMEEPKGLHQK